VTDGRSDGQTVGQTESIMAKTALCIASYADALSKMANMTLEVTAKRLRTLCQCKPVIHSMSVKLQHLIHLSEITFYSHRDINL